MIYQPLDDRIHAVLENAYDPETGELLIPEEDLFEEIQNIHDDHEVILDSVTCELKDLLAEASAVKAEKMKLAARQSQLEKRAERMKRLLFWLLQGEKWKNARHTISYRKSSELVLDDDFIPWAEVNAPGLLRFKEPEPMKDEIKMAIKNGTFFDHAHLEEKINIQIK